MKGKKYRIVGGELDGEYMTRKEIKAYTGWGINYIGRQRVGGDFIWNPPNPWGFYKRKGRVVNNVKEGSQDDDTVKFSDRVTDGDPLLNQFARMPW